MQLHRQHGAGDAVAQLVGEPATHLPKKPQALVALGGLLELRELLSHVVHRLAEVAELVMVAGQGHGTEIAGGDKSRAPTKLADAPAQPLGHAGRQSQRSQPDETP